MLLTKKKKKKKNILEKNLNIFGFIVTKSNSLSMDEKSRDVDSRPECAPSQACGCPRSGFRLESSGWTGGQVVGKDETSPKAPSILE